MDDVLYREEILDHFHSSPHRGSIESPDLSDELDNPLCGDRVRMDLKVDGRGRIEQVRFDGQGCAISQAAASILAEHVEGKTVDEVRQFSSNDMLTLLGLPLGGLRVKCGLLAWQVLRHATAEKDKD